MTERWAMCNGFGRWHWQYGAGVDNLAPAFAHRVLIWLAMFENNRVQSHHLDPALCQFPLQSSDQWLAFVSGSKSECEAIPFHHQVFLLVHELSALAIQCSDTFCQMLDLPQHEPLFLSRARAWRISVQQSQPE
jgi:hypothetical protein